MNKETVESLKGYGLDAGLLLTRGMLGTVFMFHGAQKLFGWFGGYGIEGTAGFFEKIGIPFPVLNVYLAGGTELFGGLLLILGLATRFSGFSLFFTMMVAVVTAHWGVFSAQAGGMEYPLTLGVVALALLFTGAGRASADAALVPVLLRLRTTDERTAIATRGAVAVR